jgi:hypothetical protein
MMEKIDALYLEDPCSGSRQMVGYPVRDDRESSGLPVNALQGPSAS